MTRDAWCQAGRELRAPGWHSRVWPSTPLGTHYFVQLLWKLRRLLYIAGTLKPCASTLSTKWYLLCLHVPPRVMTKCCSSMHSAWAVALILHVLSTFFVFSHCQFIVEQMWSALYPKAPFTYTQLAWNLTVVIERRFFCTLYLDASARLHKKFSLDFYTMCEMA